MIVVKREVIELELSLAVGDRLLIVVGNGIRDLDQRAYHGRARGVQDSAMDGS